MNPIVLIPARMASQRLPNKPLELIGGKPMIVHVWQRAVKAGVGEVVVACDGEAIAEAVTRAGGRVVVTDPNLPSGSDRIYQALTNIDPKRVHDIVVNVQGDMPTFDPALINQSIALLKNPAVDIGTLAAIITEEREKTDPAVVKPVIAFETATRGRALYFSRTAVPSGDGPLYHHIGLYAYRRAALEKFVKLPPSPLEKREKLEQLRALEAGMRIDVAIVDTVPLGVDTPETLDIARKWHEQGRK
jgi:3-deoxy-manno-octulosonate cytidylyltransferase (CMP-KDO synthetase)